MSVEVIKLLLKQAIVTQTESWRFEKKEIYLSLNISSNESIHTFGIIFLGFNRTGSTPIAKISITIPRHFTYCHNIVERNQRHIIERVHHARGYCFVAEIWPNPMWLGEHDQHTSNRPLVGHEANIPMDGHVAICCAYSTCQRRQETERECTVFELHGEMENKGEKHLLHRKY